MSCQEHGNEHHSITSRTQCHQHQHRVIHVTGNQDQAKLLTRPFTDICLGDSDDPMSLAFEYVTHGSTNSHKVRAVCLSKWTISRAMVLEHLEQELRAQFHLRGRNRETTISRLGQKSMNIFSSSIVMVFFISFAHVFNCWVVLRRRGPSTTTLRNMSCPSRKIHHCRGGQGMECRLQNVEDTRDRQLQHVRPQWPNFDPREDNLERLGRHLVIHPSLALIFCIARHLCGSCGRRDPHCAQGVASSWTSCAWTDVGLAVRTSVGACCPTLAFRNR